jgi:GT2 family glycosyltransferase
LRAQDLHSVGGFDESIFLYGEDIELCERLGKRGTLWLVPEATANHVIAGSQGRVSTRWTDALDRLYARRAGRFQLAAFDLVMALGLALRAVVASSKSKDPEQAIHRRRMSSGSRRCFVLALLAIGRGSRRTRRDQS